MFTIPTSIKTANNAIIPKIVVIKLTYSVTTTDSLNLVESKLIKRKNSKPSNQAETGFGNHASSIIL